MTQSAKDHLLQRLDEINQRKVMIIGDICMDEYVFGDAKRISPEAPVPVVEVYEENQGLGMSGFVAANVTQLGGEPVLLSAVGADRTGEAMRELLQNENINADHLIVDEQRPTTRKLRVLAQDHHIVRVDYESRRMLSETAEERLIARAKDLMSTVDGVIVQDYAKGLISANLVKQISNHAFQQGKPVLVDPHRTTPVDTYQGVDLLKPNLDEALALTNITHDDLRRGRRTLDQVGDSLMRQTRAKKLVITRGKDGMRIFEQGQTTDVPTYSRQVYDVTGAGDTVIAALSLALFAGWSLEDACRMANFAAGVVVSKVGCVPCSREELAAYIQSH